jgi:hypothetical protein
LSADGRSTRRGSVRPTVTVTSHPLWQIRVVRGLPRYLLAAVATAGLAASARFAIAPPKGPRVVAARHDEPPRDQGAEGFATLFARRYLSWDAAYPGTGGHVLEAFGGPGVEPDGGITPPDSGEEHVEWAEVVQERDEGAGQRVFTVATQTDTAGLLYLAVGVARSTNGELQLSGYPALVGPPIAGHARPAAHLAEVTDRGLETVVERGLRNYLADSPEELAADLARGARVSLPTPALSLESIERLGWTPDGSSVLAVVRAQDGRGVRYTLAYELEVVRAQGRWEISAVEMDPGA